MKVGEVLTHWFPFWLLWFSYYLLCGKIENRYNVLYLRFPIRKRAVFEDEIAPSPRLDFPAQLCQVAGFLKALVESAATANGFARTVNRQRLQDSGSARCRWRDESRGRGVRRHSVVI